MHFKHGVRGGIDGCMMVTVCFYFQVHQPFRLRRYPVFDIGRNHQYFDDQKNAEVMRKVAGKCYLPTNRVLLELIHKHPGQFKVSFSISGVCLEQMQLYAPEVLKSFQDLAATGQVEFLAETYYHSLSFLYDKEEFRRQVQRQVETVQRLFGQTPKAFRNTELIYNNELAWHIEQMGFTTVLSEGWDPVLGWRNSNFVYRSKTTNNLKLLMKNYRLSDDVAFRFSNRGWEGWPLTAEKYAQWLSAVNGAGQVEEPEKTDEKCELCGSPMQIKHGRFGKFLGCTKYPDCKGIKRIEILTGVKCPSCGEGDIIEKKSRGGKTFYACNQYPKCKTSFFAKPINEKCPDCNSQLVYGPKGTYKCSSKECKFSKKAE